LAWRLQGRWPLLRQGRPIPPITGQRVYDYANIFSPAARANAEATSYRIEQRTGAQVAVYTQVKPQSDTPTKPTRMPGH